MIQPTATEDSLTIRRHYNASPERVYDAWTQVEQLSQWFGPSDDYTNPFLEADVRVGGRYRIGFQKEGEELNVVAGEYRVVEPPSKLVFTWCAGRALSATAESHNRGAPPATPAHRRP